MDQAKRKYRFVLVLLGWGLLIAGALLLYRRLDFPEDVPNAGGEAAPSVRGAPAPGFKLPDLNGSTVSLQDFRGKVVLLNFWGTTCAPCIQEIPWLVEFQNQFESRGLQVVAVSMYGEGPEVLKPYVAQHRMEELNVLIGNEQVAGLFGLVGFPTTFLVDREGKYYSKHEGLMDRSRVEEELAALLNEPQ